MPSTPPFADPSLVSFHDPFAAPWHFFGLELIVYLCFALTIRHAWKAHKAGDDFHLFQWIVVFLYGLAMELIAFNFMRNYAHATFSVQFYHGLLPLYVTCIYLVFQYTGIKLVERLGLPLGRTALLAGLAIMTLDVPFDTLGPDAGWWTWADNTQGALHPRFIEAVRTRWFGVPVTSYYWYLMYGALLVLFTHWAWRRVEGRGAAVRFAVAPLVSLAVVVAGAAAFELMFWTPKALGLGDGAIVGIYLGAMLVLALVVRTPAARAAPPWLIAIPVLFFGFHLALLASLWIQGDFPDGAGKTLFILPAVGVVFALTFRDRLTLAPGRRKMKHVSVGEGSSLAPR